MPDLSKLSSYQNPEGTLKDRLAPRVKDRLGMINWAGFKDRTVLDIGCNNGMFVREAMKHGAKRAVGVDKSDCIIGARQLAKGKEEFWQVDVESEEFKRFCPRFDIVMVLSVLTHLKDKEVFLDWLDGIVKFALYFETNHGEPNKKHIELVKKHIYFDSCHYLGPTDIPEKPHYMWLCLKSSHEMRYPDISTAPVVFVPLNKITGIDEETILRQTTTYSVDSEKFLKLKEDIKKRGIREPIILEESFKMFQGGHRYLAAKQLGYKDVPCRIIKSGLRQTKIDGRPIRRL
ncbi:MAG TPA: methyltransferase domain-containing protein [bacterium]|nr:methyltransferase domain-containing protein [bacterium]